MYLHSDGWDPILTVAKNHRCRCGGVCNEWGDGHHYINTLILVSHSQSTESNMVIKCTGTA